MATPAGRRAVRLRGHRTANRRSSSPAVRAWREPPQDPGRSPNTNWPLWTAFLALVGALVLTTVLSWWWTSRRRRWGRRSPARTRPPGLTIADTFVQDVCFVLVSIWCAQLGARKVASWQFGLRRPAAGLAAGRRVVVVLLLTFIAAQRGLVLGREPEQGEAARTARHQRRHAAAGAERGADVHRGADVRGVPVPRLHLHGAAQLARDAGRRR